MPFGRVECEFSKRVRKALRRLGLALIALYPPEGLWYAEREGVRTLRTRLPMLKTLYTKTFPSTTDAVGKTVNEALEVLSQHHFCDSDSACFSLRLCLEEALVNAIVHGNDSRAERTVRLEIACDGDRCRVSVADEGSGFDPQEVEMADCNQLGGRGVCLIKHFMDEVKFNRARHCLEMTFRRGNLSREEESHAT